jgi:glucose-6-phosphate 1-epimerase
MSMNAAVPFASEKDHGRVAFIDAQNELPMLEVTTPWSTAEIYLLGAHVTSFQKRNEAPLLFMSQCSRFEEGQPIRGGIPVIFPWFGPREGLPQHGFARLKSWELKELLHSPEGSVTVRFRLPECPEALSFPPHRVEYAVTVKDDLALELSVTNDSAEEVFTFENCLHTYLHVGDVMAISLAGLKGVRYLDKVASFAEKTEPEEVLRISSEVDRIFLDTQGPVELSDPRLGRKVRVEKQGSASTVVWNPWLKKAQQMPDFGNDEFTRMVCVESGNVAANEIRLEPGQTSKLFVRLSTSTL